MNQQDYKALPDNLRPLADEVMHVSTKLDKLVKVLLDLEPVEVTPADPSEPRCAKHPREPVSYTCKACVDDILQNQNKKEIT